MMKLLTLACVLPVLFLQTVKSQDSLKETKHQDSLINPVFYMAYIYQPHRHSVKGYLVTINDSSLYISQNRMPLSFDNTNFSYFEKFDYSSIEKVKVRKPKVMGRSVITGAIIGIVTGAIIGFALGDDTGWFGFTAGEKAVVGGIIGGGVGSAVGAIVGNESAKKFLINGEWESLQEMKISLQNR